MTAPGLLARHGAADVTVTNTGPAEAAQALSRVAR